MRSFPPVKEQALCGDWPSGIPKDKEQNILLIDHSWPLICQWCVAQFGLRGTRLYPREMAGSECPGANVGNPRPTSCPSVEMRARNAPRALSARADNKVVSRHLPAHLPGIGPSSSASDPAGQGRRGCVLETSLQVKCHPDSGNLFRYLLIWEVKRSLSRARNHFTRRNRPRESSRDLDRTIFRQMFAFGRCGWGRR